MTNATNQHEPSHHDNPLHNDPAHENPAQQKADKTPLEAVKERQAAMQKSRAVVEQRPDHNPEVPGQSNPSNRRKHPQRQMNG